MPGGRRTPPWGTFCVSVLLIGTAVYLINRGDANGLAGAIIGGLISYWLPTNRSESGEDPNGRPIGAFRKGRVPVPPLRRRRPVPPADSDTGATPGE